MKFCIQLSADYPDKSYGGDRVYADMLAQARLADHLGYDAVSITEHHLVNCLMMPAPLQFAVKIAAETQRVKIMTSVVVLPLHDMRVYAGEVVVADIFTEGRLMLGVGRGAFPFEMERLGVPMAETRARFDESLAVLQALLSREEVSWDGDCYQFDPITIMPRPVRPGGPAMMMAVMSPEGIAACVKRGFHIQTTPLSGDHSLLEAQATAFHEAKAAMGAPGRDLSLTLSRVAFAAAGAADREAKIDAAHVYYGRFDNIYTGPGLVDAGVIRPLPAKTGRDALGESLLIGESPELVDKLAPYAALGVDRVILNVNFGADPQETLDAIQRFAEEVAPHFAERTRAAAAPARPEEPPQTAGAAA